MEIQPVVPFEEDIYEDGLEASAPEVAEKFFSVPPTFRTGNRKARRNLAKQQGRLVRQAYGFGLVTDTRRKPGWFNPPSPAPRDKQ